jgi:hypothetical protein
MARPNPVRNIMQAPLPSRTYQRRKLFRPDDDSINYAYNILNRYIFDRQLRQPEIVTGRLNAAWGVCSWSSQQQASGSHCDIWLSNKWYCPQWFMNVLAHEMAHQYQWDVYRWEYQSQYGCRMYDDSAGHGPSFFMWRDRFAHYGLTLKTSFSQSRWFRHQDFSRC